MNEIEISQRWAVLCRANSMSTLKMILKKLETFTEIWSDGIDSEIICDEEQRSPHKLGQISFYADNRIVRDSLFQFILSQLCCNLMRRFKNIELTVFPDP